MNINFVGNLTRDPEAIGETGAKFSVAHNSRRKGPDGWEEHVDYLNVAVFGWQAPPCLEHLAKGRQVAVCGRLDVKDYVTKDGEKRIDLSVIAYEVTFVGGKPTGGAREEEHEKKPQKDIPW